MHRMTVAAAEASCIHVIALVPCGVGYGLSNGQTPSGAEAEYENNVCC